MKWIFWTLLVAFLVVGGSWFYRQRIVHQPIRFSHKHHEGMDCQLCHAGVWERARAGFPSLELCIKCHATIPTQKPEEIERWKRFSKEGKIPWRSFYQVPEHAYFSHRRHVQEGKLGCSICHGLIHKLDEPPKRALISFSMDRCVQCHTERKVTADCNSCHR